MRQGRKRYPSRDFLSSSKSATLLTTYDLERYGLKALSNWFHWMQGSEFYIIAAERLHTGNGSRLMYIGVDWESNTINCIKSIHVEGWVSQIVFLDNHVVVATIEEHHLVFLDFAKQEVMAKVKEISNVNYLYRRGASSVVVRCIERERLFSNRWNQKMYEVDLQEDNTYIFQEVRRKCIVAEMPSATETPWDLKSRESCVHRLGTVPKMDSYMEKFTSSEKWFVSINPFSDPGVTEVRICEMHELQEEPRVVTLPYFRNLIEVAIVGDFMLWNGSPKQKRFGVPFLNPRGVQKNFGVMNLRTGACEWEASHDLVDSTDIAKKLGFNFAVLPDGTLLTTMKDHDNDSNKFVFARYRLPEPMASRLQSQAKSSLSWEAGPPLLLQDALGSVLRGCSSPVEQCLRLISKKNCAASTVEWNAAHQLLVLAVKDGSLTPYEGVHGNLYHWRDQLYCTVSDLQIANDEEKHEIHKCLRDAQELALIDSADAYIQGIHVMECVRKEFLSLKRAGIMLLERVLALEGSVEKLKEAFKRYRETQLFSNVVGIAVQLIPLAGGVLSKVLMAGCEVVEGLSAGDVVEYALSIAGIVLEEGEFMKLPLKRQEEVKAVFAEFGYTRDDVRVLMRDSNGTRCLESDDGRL